VSGPVTGNADDCQWQRWRHLAPAVAAQSCNIEWTAITTMS